MSHQVLFVDEEGSVLKAIQRNLSFQLEIATAYSAQEGLKVLTEDGRFDVVVTDISMPGMSGLDFADQVARLLPDPLLIIFSGCDDPSTLARTEENPLSLKY